MRKQWVRFFVQLILGGLVVCLTAETIWADLRQQTAEDYRRQGYEAQQIGNTKVAMEHYSKAVSLGILDVKVYNELAILYENNGLRGRAEQLYLKALQMDSSYLPAYMNLAYLYLAQGKKDKAATYFKKRFELSQPGDPWRQKASAELLKINPSYRGWIAQIEADYLQKEMVQKQREEFTRRLTVAHEHYQQGLQKMGVRQYESAIHEFDQALLLTPHNKKVVEARQKAALEIVKNDVRARSDRAIRMLDEGDTYSAKGEIHKILTTIPQEP